MKEKTTLSIDEELKKKAEEAGLNMSAVAERAIRSKLNYKEIEIKDFCEFCGRAEQKATAKKPVGLTWLCPDEKWICNSCLRHKINNVPIANKW